MFADVLRWLGWTGRCVDDLNELDLLPSLLRPSRSRKFTFRFPSGDQSGQVSSYAPVSELQWFGPIGFL